MDPSKAHEDLYDLPDGEQKNKAAVENAAVYERSLTEADEEESTLDEILLQIGQLGLFQIIILLLICVAMLFSAIYSVTYVFTASSVVHR